MKGYLKLYEWADCLAETGPEGYVGVNMIRKIKGVIREAYKAGIKDGGQVSAQRRLARPNRGIRR